MESNLRDAIDYLVELGAENEKPEVVEICGKTYCTKNLKRYDSKPKAQTIQAKTLTSLVEYILRNRHELADRMILQVKSPDKVTLYSGLDQEREREYLFEAVPEIPYFEFGHSHSQETFIIAMQSCFIKNKDSEIILQVSGNVEKKSVANYGDDGITQKATISQGIATKVDTVVPNPVTLRPYRTFLEVEQPESNFVFRITDDRNGEPGFKLVEADGGAWKYKAMQSVKDYLCEQLKDLIEQDILTVIA